MKPRTLDRVGVRCCRVDRRRRRAARRQGRCERRPPISRPRRAAAEHVAGFFDVYRDAAKGRVLLGVHALDTPFLLVTSLPWGLGSNDVGLDRGQSGESHLVEFRRVGPRLLLVEDNTKFRAVSSNPDEALSVRQAFAESVLWAGDIVGERKGADAEVIVDVGSLLTSDRHGIARRLAEAKQGKYELDDKRSAVSLADAKSFPDNTELEALLTFKGPGDQQFVKDVAMDPESLTLRQHLSLVRLPRAGLRAARVPSGVGRFQRRLLRLRAAARVEPRRALPAAFPSRQDRSVRGAKRRQETDRVLSRSRRAGARALGAARRRELVEDRIRESRLQGCVPRRAAARRRRSDGHPLQHHHLGASLHARLVVRPADRRSAHRRDHQGLGDARLAARAPGHPDRRKPARAVRQDRTRRELANEAEQMALARLRQLAAHEVGHALGFAHNFAASRLGNGSVMDYPHPLLKLDADGAIGLDHAYGVGVGPWDDFLVAHAYGQFPAGQEGASLAKLRADIAKAGFRYMSDPDSRAPGDAEAGWHCCGISVRTR